jgi:hypothetical protein
VLDVARAVEPAGIETAKAALAKRAGGVVPAGVGPNFTLGGIGGIAAPLARTAERPPEAETYKKFEAMVLQTFVQNMLPRNAESVYGAGMAGDMWKSMMAGKIADVVAERGGIGIARSMLADHYIDGERVVPVGPVSRGPERADLDRQAMMSTALVHEMQRRMTDVMTDTPAGPGLLPKL